MSIERTQEVIKYILIRKEEKITNQIMKECGKLNQKMYKNRHEWVEMGSISNAASGGI